LSHTEVAQRQADGLTNATPSAPSRTLAQILRANVLTRFNAILGALFVVVAVVGPPQDGLFGVILVVNTAIGVGQEWRAKRTLERLALLSAPLAHARRDGTTVDLPADDVVLDDLLEVRSGDQVVADGRVVAAQDLDLDESLLTGESEVVSKRPGDPVLSGSVVVEGSGTIQVVRVGGDAFAQKLQGDARRFSLVRSELQQGTNELLRYISWAMVPLTALLVTSQIVRSGLDRSEALRGTVAGVGAMVPEGLVLLTTIAFALSALRLARRRVLTQELAAIEGLARVDVLCIDKTGTLTSGQMTLIEVVALHERPSTEALAAMAAADPAPNLTMQTLRSLPVPGAWEPTATIAFSSARKWSAASFAGQGTWVLGAPDMVVAELPTAVTARVAELTAAGHRVLLLARSDAALSDKQLPDGLVPAALVVLGEAVRPDAEATLAYLREQGVTVKVLSGDDPATVGAIARRVGIDGWAVPVDARGLPDDPGALRQVVESTSVIGRVQPYQKRLVVEALQAEGHVVAMTGDGVNDVPAVKAADLGIAMGAGSAATRAVARLVLLDDAFEVIPRILDEGRRVIANVERVAKLFVTKSVYAALLALYVGLTAVAYPFYPRHLTIVSSLTIGIPGFFLAFEPGAPRATPGFLSKVLRFTVPAGIVAAAVTVVAYTIAKGPAAASAEQSRTAATLALLLIGLVVLALAARPLTLLRGLLVGAMAALALPIWFVPWSRTTFGLAEPPASATLGALGAALVGSVVLVAGLRLVARRSGERPGGPPTAPGDQRRSDRAVSAACQPHIPCTPGPGGVAEEHR
jgi:cation-transporting ATPase E